MKVRIYKKYCFWTVSLPIKYIYIYMSLLLHIFTNFIGILFFFFYFFFGLFFWKTHVSENDCFGSLPWKYIDIHVQYLTYIYQTSSWNTLFFFLFFSTSFFFGCCLWKHSLFNKWRCLYLTIISIFISKIFIICCCRISFCDEYSHSRRCKIVR